MKSTKCGWLSIMFILIFGVAVSSSSMKVKAGSKVGLDYNKKYTSYDVTGDGSADTIILKTSGQYSDMADTLTVYVNDTNVLIEKADYGFYDNSSYIQDNYLIYMDNGKVLLLTYLSGDNGDGPIRIYEFSDGRMVLLADVVKDFFNVGGHISPEIKNVGTDTLSIEISTMSHALAGLNFNVTYKYNNGKLKLTGKTHKIVSYSANYVPGKTYLTSLKKITLYKDKTTKKVYKKYRKGTKIKFSKIYVSGKKINYYGKTKSGKKGWIKTTNKTFKIFKESLYAG